jgi:hypothetical protein
MPVAWERTGGERVSEAEATSSRLLVAPLRRREPSPVTDSPSLSPLAPSLFRLLACSAELSDRGAPELERPHIDAPLQRLSNGFSRKIENHMAAVAINYFAYNFIKIHRTLRVSPAMAAGVTTRLFDVMDLVNLLNEVESKKAA